MHQGWSSDVTAMSLKIVQNMKFFTILVILIINVLYLKIKPDRTTANVIIMWHQ